MLPSRSGRPRALALTVAGISCALGIVSVVVAASNSPQPAVSPSASPTPGMFSTIPLPIGQEAKGLILPDFDLQGRMRARFEASMAKRIDADHIQFSGMKMTTFTPESGVDLKIEMPVSTLDLKTRVMTSSQRTSVERRDFVISGDSLEFDTVARKGTLRGNVKMVITDQSDFIKKPEPEKPGE